MDDRFRRIVVYVVLAVWVASFALSLVVRSYKPPPEVTSALLAVLGLIGVAEVAGARKKDDRKDDDSDDQQGISS